jgi:hypothetical protein
VRPRILGALLDTVQHGLRALTGFGQPPRWSTSNGRLHPLGPPPGRPPSGQLGQSRGGYEANRRPEPVANCVREIVAGRNDWIGTAADLLSLGAGCSGDRLSWRSWPRNPRSIASRLQRAQTPLRSLGIEILFSQEEKAGTRIIQINDVGKSPPGQRRDSDHHRNGRIQKPAYTPTPN